ncbi:MAG: 30S ribosomal protein S5 [Patescibacteria group bacterium]
MTDEVKIPNAEPINEPKTEATGAAGQKEEAKAEGSQSETQKSSRPFGRPFKGGRAGKGGPGKGRGRGERRLPKADVPVESDYEEKNIEVARVTRVTKGGKRMRFRVLAVIGNHKGRVGYGLAKGLDVAAATQKATAKARKSLITVPLLNETIPHPVIIKHGAAQLVLKPAPKGTGVKAGGAVRSVLELAGIPNVTAKILGTKNKINNVKAAVEALSRLKSVQVEAGKEAGVNEKEEAVKTDK